MQPILLIDEDVTFCACMKLFLNEKGYAVTVQNMKSLLTLLNHKAIKYLCVIIDTSVTNFSYAVLKELKKKHSKIVVMLLSRQDTVSNRLQAFTVGADDFLKKPCSLFELELRIRRLLIFYEERRHAQIDLLCCEDKLPQQFKKIQFMLTPQFRSIFSLLFSVKGHLMPYEVLENKLGIEQRSSLTVAIHRMNRLFRSNKVAAQIKGVYGRGYRLVIYDKEYFEF